MHMAKVQQVSHPVSVAIGVLDRLLSVNLQITILCRGHCFRPAVGIVRPEGVWSRSRIARNIVSCLQRVIQHSGLPDPSSLLCLTTGAYEDLQSLHLDRQLSYAKRVTICVPFRHILGSRWPSQL